MWRDLRNRAFFGTSQQSAAKSRNPSQAKGFCLQAQTKGDETNRATFQTGNCAKLGHFFGTFLRSITFLATKLQYFCERLRPEAELPFFFCVIQTVQFLMVPEKETACGFRIFFSNI
ncbi:MAG: hypothetical protein K1Y36_24390 [Blastocatellia bacterium]|nr:hypothetical protein [Blastocatellia bacterium]